jgi:GAF domain-containing protein
MNAILILPLQVANEPWGLVELYEMRLHRFSEHEVAVARSFTTHA